MSNRLIVLKIVILCLMVLAVAVSGLFLPRWLKAIGLTIWLAPVITFTLGLIIGWFGMRSVIRSLDR